MAGLEFDGVWAARAAASVFISYPSARVKFAEFDLRCLLSVLEAKGNRLSITALLRSDMASGLFMCGGAGHDGLSISRFR